MLEIKACAVSKKRSLRSQMSFLETSLPTAGRRNAEIGHYGQTLLSQNQRLIGVTIKNQTEFLHVPFIMNCITLGTI